MEGVKSKEDKDKNDNDIEKEEISVPIETPSKHRKIHRKHIRHHHRHIKNSNNKTITDTGGDKNKTTKFKKSKKELNRRVSEISVPIETPRKHRKVHRKHIKHHHRHIKNSSNQSITDTSDDKNKTTKFKKSKKELNQIIPTPYSYPNAEHVNFIQNIDESSQKGDPKFIKRSIVKRRPPTVIANFQNHDN